MKDLKRNVFFILQNKSGVVSIATRLRAGRFWVRILVDVNTFLSSKTPRPALGSTQPPIQWITPGSFPGREFNYSPPSSADIKNDSAIPPLRYYALKVWIGKTLPLTKASMIIHTFSKTWIKLVI